MRISCVLDVGQLANANGTPGLIVFPESVAQTEIDNAWSLCPDSMIVAAVLEDRRSRGLLLHQWRNQINYLKVTNDGRTIGSGNLQQMPVYQLDNLCVGVLICMDVDHSTFSQAIIRKVRASECRLKLICIPADMGSYWFTGDTVPSQLHGVNVILCNHTKTHQERCKSFVTDMHGRKVVIQKHDEPIHIQLP